MKNPKKYEFLKNHNGMRSHDVLILMFIFSTKYPEGIWKKLENEEVSEISKKKLLIFPLSHQNNKEIAQALKLRDSEVSESLYRSEYAGLIESVK